MPTVIEEKKCIGFTLLREYPNCRKRVGDFEPFTTGEFLKYSEIWKPVYKAQTVPKRKIIVEITV